MSIFWKIFAAMWLDMSAVKDWHTKNFGFAVNYGKGSAGAKMVAQMLQNKFSESHGYIGTMDWSQCYDGMRPEVTVAALRGLGW